MTKKRKSQKKADKLSIILADEQFRGGWSPIDISPKEFRKQVTSFVGALTTSFSEIQKPADNVKLSEFTVTATVGGKGKLSLLGTGAEASGSAGISFKFTVG